MIYFDTSYLLKCYVNEDGSDEVRALASDSDRIACCEFGRIELFAGFHRCLRERRLSRDELEVIGDQYEVDEQDQLWSWLPMSRSLMSGVVAAFRTLSEDVHLRSGDAIHLVCARDHDITTIYTSDRSMLRAASTFGLDARNVIPPHRCRPA